MGFTNLSVLTWNMGFALHIKLRWECGEITEKLEMKIIIEKGRNLRWVGEMTVKVMWVIIKLLLGLLI